MLVKAEQWKEQTFVKESQPDMRTIKRWISKGIIVGTIIDTTAYIDDMEFNKGLARQSLARATNHKFVFKEV